jgi:hypothetical protein
MTDATETTNNINLVGIWGSPKEMSERMNEIDNK